MCEVQWEWGTTLRIYQVPECLNVTTCTSDQSDLISHIHTHREQMPKCRTSDTLYDHVNSEQFRLIWSRSREIVEGPMAFWNHDK